MIISFHFLATYRPGGVVRLPPSLFLYRMAGQTHNPDQDNAFRPVPEVNNIIIYW